MPTAGVKITAKQVQDFVPRKSKLIQWPECDSLALGTLRNYEIRNVISTSLSFPGCHLILLMKPEWSSQPILFHKVVVSVAIQSMGNWIQHLLVLPRDKHQNMTDGFATLKTRCLSPCGLMHAFRLCRRTGKNIGGHSMTSQPGGDSLPMGVTPS
jgi:hypothetical protein